MPDTNDTTTTSVKKPTWNTSPNTLPGFVLDLQKYLPKRDARYKALVEYGYILERRSVICVSDNHIDRVRQQLVPKGSFAAPTIINPGDFDASGLTVMTDVERQAYEALPDRNRVRSCQGTQGAALSAPGGTPLRARVCLTSCGCFPIP